MCFEINLYFRIRFNINIDYYENDVEIFMINLLAKITKNNYF